MNIIKKITKWFKPDLLTQIEKDLLSTIDRNNLVSIYMEKDNDLVKIKLTAKKAGIIIGAKGNRISALSKRLENQYNCRISMSVSNFDTLTL